MEDKAEQSHHSWRHHLATILFLWFMVLSLGPLMVIGLVEYEYARKRILNDRFEQLSTINVLLSEQLNDFFDEIVTNLFVRSWGGQEFINRLVESHELSNLSVNDYIKSQDYNQLTGEYADEFTDFVEHYGYSDVIIGDAKGTIFYTVNERSDLGENIFTGPLASTAFSKSVKESITSYKPRFTPVEDYLQSVGELVSFFIMPLVDDSEEVSGFIAVQVYASNIQEIFKRQGDILGKSVNSYLVGSDGVIVFGTSYSPELKLALSPSNPLMALWLSHVDPSTGNYVEDDEHLMESSGHDHDENHQAKSQKKISPSKSYSHIKSYKNIDRKDVLGIYYPVNVGGTPMAMVSEVSHKDSFSPVYQFRNRILLVSGIIFIAVIILAIFITRKLVKPIKTITHWVKRVSSGDYVQGTVLSGNTEISELSKNFKHMTEKLRSISNENEQRSWMQEGLAGLNDSLRGDLGMSDLCKNIVTYLCQYLEFQTGAMYVLGEDKILHLMGSYAWSTRKQHANQFAIGEGLVGQAALEKATIEIVDVPPDYLVIESGLGSSTPHSLLIIPLVYENELKGVFEFALLHSVTDKQSEFMTQSIESVAISINSAQYRARVNQLLDKTTKQSDVLKEQQEELKTINEELEKRAAILEESEEELKVQSEELQRSNSELEEKSEQLLQQKEQIEQKNHDIEISKKAIEDKAKELEQSSKYKSEFLANMSHELRTPLNSLLLLSQMLADNDEGNLNDDQIESAKVIYNGGKELLDLINDILDLSKIEAGKMSVNLEYVDIQDLCSGIKKLFKPLADNKSLEFTVSILKGTSSSILSDSQRLLQIIKNFLSNAFKFTEEGGVHITVFSTSREGKYGKLHYVSFSIRDTGIGIPQDKQAAIFEAFQQADGSTSRKYGGTGLGLAISKEFAELLGGFIELESVENEGTTFSVLVPENPVLPIGNEEAFASSHEPGVVEKTIDNTIDISSEVMPKSVTTPEKPVVENKTGQVPGIEPDKPCLLLIEDDPSFMDILSKISEKNNFQYLNADTGEKGLRLASSIKPDAIILDLGLPDMDGQEVLSKLQANQSTKNIPVHIITGRDPETVKSEGVVGYLVKPVSMADLHGVFVTLEDAINSDIHRVLVLDSDDKARAYVSNILKKKGIDVCMCETPTEASEMLMEKRWQCLVMDYDPEGGRDLAFLKNTQEQLGSDMPFVIIYTAKELSEAEYKELQQYTSTMVMKGAMASDRVTNEVNLFLHSLQRTGRDKDDEVNGGLADRENRSLEGHKLLLVDDDLRNTFALSKALQGFGMEVVMADNGKVALEKLSDEGDIELVLMDIMMPVMDGYEAMKEIRRTPAYNGIPVIALTAKAMAEDRGKCIDAGANDYMTKPIDMDKLVAMLKVWLLK
ncbi:response regulator [Candidatus Sororendozoicomonas aggregata]|uniref:response regulator n=1 Tax=Candidatus Sororendozoicomonas aggregata TaxID=3073239 RepID=UPI002ECFCB09